MNGDFELLDIQIDPADFPLSEPLVLHKGIATLHSHFDAGLFESDDIRPDLDFLSSLPPTTCFTGAYVDNPVFPFLCKLSRLQEYITAADILRYLKVRNFQSKFINNLESLCIPYPGYHPGNGTGVENDEIHNDFTGQCIFQSEPDNCHPIINEHTGAHGTLKRSVCNGKLWYVLLHPTPKQDGEFLFCDNVLVFALGKSLASDHLIGVVTHQACHNLCD